LLHKVLKPFRFAGNGHTVESLNVDDEREFGSSTEGLVAEGYIAEIVAARTAAEGDAAGSEEAVDDADEITHADDNADPTVEQPRRGRPRKS
jgi:hypothetical protein